MESKAVSGIMLTLLIIGMLALALDIQVAKGEPEPRVYIDPPLNWAPMDTYFTVNIKIANVTNLVSWGITLYVRKSVLETNGSMIQEGPFLKLDGTPTQFIANFDSLYWFIGCLITTPSPGVNGSGTLVSITFRVLAEGESSIVLVETNLRNPAMNPIPHTSKDGYFSNVRDIAVRDVVAYPRVSVGEPVFINVTVRNNGNETETFDVTVNYDNIIIGSQTVTSLNPGTFLTLTIIWNTTGVANETYTISANASVLEGEVDTDNNRFVDGKVTLARVRTETVYIRADGSVDPDVAPITSVDNITYTLTDNIVADIPEESSGIVLERDNIVIDGGGYTLEGTEAWVSKGIDLTGRGNVTIKNMKIKAFGYGIYFDGCLNNTISGNNITNNTRGIYLNNSANNNIFGDDIKAYLDGIRLNGCSNSTISGNNITNNAYGGWGIRLYRCLNSIISGNNIITANLGDGIFLGHSSNNVISGNKIIANGRIGISLSDSSNNTISRNNVTNSWICILLYHSPNNAICGNNIANSDHGIELYYSSSYDNTIYHNNFVDNTEQVDSEGATNVWDGGYPSGGNYWSDYAGVDAYTGPFQNETGSDGIGDTPYVIYADNQDRYPLMGPFKEFNVAFESITYHVDVFSNSTLPNFSFNEADKLISFNVTGPDGTLGFCRVTIPKILLGGPYTVMVDNLLPTKLTETSNGIVTFLYFTYSHATKNVKIIGTRVGPISGDVNRDGIVSITDVVIAALAFGSTVAEPNIVGNLYNPFADFDSDGKISITDLVIIGVNFGKTG